MAVGIKEQFILEEVAKISMKSPIYNCSKFKEAIETLSENHFKEAELFLLKPEDCESYNKEYLEFVKKRTKSILSLNLFEGDKFTYDFEAEFKLQWVNKLDTIMKKRWKRKLKLLKKIWKKYRHLLTGEEILSKVAKKIMKTNSRSSSSSSRSSTHSSANTSPSHDTLSESSSTKTRLRSPSSFTFGPSGGYVPYFRQSSTPTRDEPPNPRRSESRSSRSYSRSRTSESGRSRTPSGALLKKEKSPLPGGSGVLPKIIESVEEELSLKQEHVPKHASEEPHSSHTCPEEIPRSTSTRNKRSKSRSFSCEKMSDSLTRSRSKSSSKGSKSKSNWRTGRSTRSRDRSRSVSKRIGSKSRSRSSMKESTRSSRSDTKSKRSKSRSQSRTITRSIRKRSRSRSRSIRKRSQSRSPSIRKRSQSRSRSIRKRSRSRSRSIRKRSRSRSRSIRIRSQSRFRSIRKRFSSRSRSVRRSHSKRKRSTSRARSIRSSNFRSDSKRKWSPSRSRSIRKSNSRSRSNIKSPLNTQRSKSTEYSPSRYILKSKASLSRSRSRSKSSSKGSKSKSNWRTGRSTRSRDHSRSASKRIGSKSRSCSSTKESKPNSRSDTKSKRSKSRSQSRTITRLIKKRSRSRSRSIRKRSQSRFCSIRKRFPSRPRSVRRSNSRSHSKRKRSTSRSHSIRSNSRSHSKRLWSPSRSRSIRSNSGSKRKRSRSRSRSIRKRSQSRSYSKRKKYSSRSYYKRKRSQSRSRSARRRSNSRSHSRRKNSKFTVQSKRKKSKSRSRSRKKDSKFRLSKKMARDRKGYRSSSNRRSRSNSSSNKRRPNFNRRKNSSRNRSRSKSRSRSKDRPTESTIGTSLSEKLAEILGNDRESKKNENTSSDCRDIKYSPWSPSSKPLVSPLLRAEQKTNTVKWIVSKEELSLLGKSEDDENNCWKPKTRPQRFQIPLDEIIDDVIPKTGELSKEEAFAHASKSNTGDSGGVENFASFKIDQQSPVMNDRTDIRSTTCSKDEKSERIRSFDNEQQFSESQCFTQTKDLTTSLSQSLGSVSPTCSTQTKLLVQTSDNFTPQVTVPPQTNSGTGFNWASPLVIDYKHTSTPILALGQKQTPLSVPGLCSETSVLGHSSTHPVISIPKISPNQSMASGSVLFPSMLSLLSPSTTTQTSHSSVARSSEERVQVPLPLSSQEKTLDDEITVMVMPLLIEIKSMKEKIGFLSHAVDTMSQTLEKNFRENKKPMFSLTTDYQLTFRLIQEQMRLIHCTGQGDPSATEMKIANDIEDLLNYGLKDRKLPPKKMYGLDIAKLKEVTLPLSSEGKKIFVKCTLRYEGLSYVTSKHVDDVYGALCDSVEDSTTK